MIVRNIIAWGMGYAIPLAIGVIAGCAAGGLLPRRTVFGALTGIVLTSVLISEWFFTRQDRWAKAEPIPFANLFFIYAGLAAEGGFVSPIFKSHRHVGKES